MLSIYWNDLIFAESFHSSIARSVVGRSRRERFGVGVTNIYQWNLMVMPISK